MIQTTGRNWTERHIRELIRQEINKSGGGGGGESDDTAFVSSLKSAFESLSMQIQLTNLEGTATSLNMIIDVKPSKLCYRSYDPSSAKTLYCIYDFTFPVIPSGGLGFPNIVMPEMKLSPVIIVGNATFASGNIDVYNGNIPAPWRVETQGNMLTYYNYTDSFTQEYRPIQFPEHIMKAVMYEMTPSNTYRYNTNGLARLFDDMVNSPTLPDNIKPFDVFTDLDNLNVIFQITPTSYALNKTVKISYLTALTKMPSLL